MQAKPVVDIYTDGACSGNPGPGGWAYILLYQGYEVEKFGWEEVTTNNRMELTAAIRALERLTQACEVHLYTDSAYVANAFNENWLKNWKMRGWKTANKQDVSNRDLWEQLDALNAKHQVHWLKVKGHADNPYNNRCDVLAVEAYKQKGTTSKE